MNYDRLPAVAREAARTAGLSPVCKNPFKSIIVRAIETLFACDEAPSALSRNDRGVLFRMKPT